MREDILIDDSWKEQLAGEFKKEYFSTLQDFIDKERNAGKLIHPADEQIYYAFQKTPFNKVKVVILGQDPYHGPGQAMGLSFSVPNGHKTPASLKRIYAELQRDVGINIPTHGDLTYWAEQGVFLLNSILTVESGMPGSHRKIGWAKFTDTIISILSDHSSDIIFMLWGNFAKAKKSLINTEKHFILEAAHPSPLAGIAFQGCAHFSKANEILNRLGKKEINWQLEEQQLALFE